MPRIGFYTGKVYADDTYLDSIGGCCLFVSDDISKWTPSELEGRRTELHRRCEGCCGCEESSIHTINRSEEKNEMTDSFWSAIAEMAVNYGVTYRVKYSQLLKTWTIIFESNGQRFGHSIFYKDLRNSVYAEGFIKEIEEQIKRMYA